MDKKLIEEIKRFNEIVNSFERTLIMEGGKSALVQDAITALRKLAKLEGKNLDDLITIYGKEAGTIMNRIFDPNSATSLADDILDLYKINKPLAEQFYNNFRSVLVQNPNANSYFVQLNKAAQEAKKILDSPNGGKDAAENYLDREIRATTEQLPEDLRDLVRQMEGNKIKNQYPELVDITSDAIKVVDDAAERAKNADPNAPKPKSKGTGSKVKQTLDANTKWEDVPPLSDETISRLAARDESFMKSFSTFKQRVIDALTATDELFQELLSAMKKLEDPNLAAGDRVLIMNRIDELLVTIQKSNISNFQYIDAFVEETLPLSIRNKVKNLKGYAKAKGVFDKASSGELEALLQKRSERSAEVRASYNAVFNPASWFGKNMDRFKTRELPTTINGKPGIRVKNLSTLEAWINKWRQILTGPEFSRFRSNFVAGSTFTRKELHTMAKDLGYPYTLAKLTPDMLMGWVMVQVWQAIADTLIGITAWSLETILPETEFLTNARIRFENAIETFSYPENKEGNRLQVAATQLLNIVSTPVNLLIQNVVDDKLHVIVPGTWDNFFYSWNKYLSEPLSQENADSVIEAGTKFKGDLEEQEYKYSNEGGERDDLNTALIPEDLKTIVSGMGGVPDSIRFDKMQGTRRLYMYTDPKYQTSYNFKKINGKWAYKLKDQPDSEYKIFQQNVNETFMKLKEQFRPVPETPETTETPKTTRATQTPRVTRTPEVTPTPTPDENETTRDGLEFFSTFTFKDRDGKEFKFSDDDKNDVKDLIPKFRNIGGKEYDDDDAFVRAAVYYLLTKGKPVFSVTYLNDADTKIQLDENRNIGLVSLLEQIETTVYIAKREGNNFTITNDKAFAERTNWAKPGDVSNMPKPKVSEPKAASTDNTETSTTTPAQDMGVTPKPEMVQKMVEKEGPESLSKVLPDNQQAVVDTYINKGYTVERPSSVTITKFDTVDLNEINPQEFPQSFLMYKIYPLDTNQLQTYINDLSEQDVNKPSCREAIKMYVDTALDRKQMSDSDRKRFATFILNCKAQFRDGFNDFKKTEKRLDVIENKLAGPQYCKYKINFNGDGKIRGSVGCADNLLEIE